MINCNAGESWKWLSMSADFFGIEHLLLDLKDGQRSLEGDQLRMFDLTNDQRNELLLLAKNLRWFTRANLKEKEHDEAYWKAYHELPYNDYDMYDFFNQYSDEELITNADLLEKIGNGEVLDDYTSLMNFITKLAYHASARHHGLRRGCF